MIPLSAQWGGHVIGIAASFSTGAVRARLYHHITQDEGVQQGDLLMPARFTVALAFAFRDLHAGLRPDFGIHFGPI